MEVASYLCTYPTFLFSEDFPMKVGWGRGVSYLDPAFGYNYGYAIPLSTWVGASHLMGYFNGAAVVNDLLVKNTPSFFIFLFLCWFSYNKFKFSVSGENFKNVPGSYCNIKKIYNVKLICNLAIFFNYILFD